MKQAALLILLCALFSGSGCSSFNRDWNAALHKPLPGDGPEGLWRGHWLSEVNGHHGRLRCIVEQTDTPGTFTTRYKATYAHILRVTYSVPVQIREQDSLFRLTGDHDLGKLAGGVYSYDGVISNGQFLATYTSRWDYGEFRMARPDQRQER